VAARKPTLPTRKGGAAVGPAIELVSDLTGGLDRRSNATLIGPTRSQRLLNVRTNVPGRWHPRPGWATFTTTNLGPSRAQGGKRIYLEGVPPFTIVGWEGDIYTPSDLGEWDSPVATGFSPTALIDFPSDSQMVAVFDGVTPPQFSTDGVSWRPLGLAGPTSAPTLTASAGGTLMTDHVYEVSVGYQGALDNFPSNEGPAATITVTMPNLTIHVVAAASADPQVTHLVIYARDVTLGESQRRFVTTVVNPGTGTVVVDLTANTWSEALEAPTTHNPAPPLEFGQVWKGRWWAKDPVGPVTIRFSEIFLPQAWPVNYTIDLPFTSGDHITAIIPYGDTLVVMGTSKPAFLIVGIGVLDFDVRPSAGSRAGCFGPRAWDLVGGRIAHASGEGVYLFDGANDGLLTTDLEQDWRDVVDVTSEPQLYRTPLVYHEAEKEVRVAVPNLTLYGQPGEFVFDPIRTGQGVPVWSMTDRALGGYISWNGPETRTGDRGRLFSWDLTTGQLREENLGTSADGADLTAQYRGPVFTSGLPMTRFLNLYAEHAVAQGVFTLTVTVDEAFVWSGTVDISGFAPTLSVALPFFLGIGGRRVFQVDLPLEAEGRGISVTGVYVGQDNFDWFTYAFTYLPEPALRGF
jgi:hypothetical protein